MRVLASEFGNILLEYDYLSSSEKLLEYQALYFENDLIQKSIENIKTLNISNNKSKIENFKIIQEWEIRINQNFL